jgi:uncharacterized protein (TIGR02099 family)
MIDPKPQPSRLLKISALAAKWSLRVLLSAWLVFMMGWGILHAVIVPRIGELRPLLETRASQVMGVTVQIGAMSARSAGLIPSIELTDVRLLDGQGREALRLPRVLAALSPRSLLGLGFEQLYIDQPQLSIRRSANGRIFVAGLDFSKGPGEDNRAADWFFSQAEFVIHQGTVQWTDEQRGVPMLALNNVDFVVRNLSQNHLFRLDATPPPQWGERFSLRAKFRQPLLSLNKGRWRDWSGQLFAEFDRVDVSELRRYAEFGVEVAQGAGAVRAWVDVNRGQIEAATADVALYGVSTTLDARLLPLELQSVTGRLTGRVMADGFEFSTQGLQFDTRDGLHWPGGNVRVVYRDGNATSAASGELTADKFDLAALSQIANRIPLSDGVHEVIARYAPTGVVDEVRATWQGDALALKAFAVKGHVSRLAVTSVPGHASPGADASVLPVGSPGLRGANIEFDLTQAGGKARLVVQDGALDFPGIFATPEVPVSGLSADFQWTVQGEKIAVQSSNLKFANADTQGEAQFKWHTREPDKADVAPRFPGVLDLQASLSRADGTRVHRYLPLALDPLVREYVREAVVGGTADDVKFKIKGNLDQLPFKDPKNGEFRVTANLRDVTFAYIPRSLQAADALPWPALYQLSGQLLIDRKQLQLKGVRARVGSATGLLMNKGEGDIPDLYQSARVLVSAEATGPLADAMALVTASPLGLMTGQVLGGAKATGNADYRIKLALPLATLSKTTIQGSVTLGGNEIQISEQTPKLVNARGVVGFTEHGFSVTGGQARMLGGDMRLDGGSGAAGSSGTTVLRAQGTVTADGLRQARELGHTTRLAQFASGSTAYSAVLTFRSAVPELVIASSLQGLGLNLPAPLNKSADTALPIRFETSLVNPVTPGSSGVTTGLQRLLLDLGRVGSLTYIRDMTTAEPKVVRGAIAVGLAAEESAPLPLEGVVANVNLTGVDVDAWTSVLSQATGATGGPGLAALNYLPDSFAIRAHELKLSGRKLNNVVMGGSREGLTWRANVDAQELNGYLEYRQPAGNNAGNAGRLYARLARLTLAPASAREVETLLDEQPASIPALDIVVEDLDLRGTRLGRVEIEAVNRGAALAARDGGAREWRLNKFNVTTPEAAFTSSGNWATVNALAVPASGASATYSPVEKRRTVMNFKMDISDAGGLLARFGMKDVVRRGKGKMEGQVAWLGSPLLLDYPTMNGAFLVNIESGQFLKADSGAAKLLGVLSLQSLPRRLALDFRDVFSDGFVFDFLRGDITIEQGMAKTNNLQMKGVNAAVLMEGRADIARETQDIKAVVVPEINAGTASLIATAINPAIGLGSFLAQLFLRRPLMEAATQEFHIDGSWSDPRVTKIDRKATP